MGFTKGGIRYRTLRVAHARTSARFKRHNLNPRPGDIRNLFRSWYIRVWKTVYQYVNFSGNGSTIFGVTVFLFIPSILCRLLALFNVILYKEIHESIYYENDKRNSYETVLFRFNFNLILLST